MFAPALKKIIESSVVHVERVLPTTGSIYAQIGTEVKPFDHLGNCNVSHSILTLPKKFTNSEKLKANTHYWPVCGVLLRK